MVMEKTVIHIVSNKVWGGGEQYVYDLARRQHADDYRVALLCRPVEAVQARLRELDVPIHTLPLKGIADLKSAWRIAQILKQTQSPCLVHVHNFKDAFTAAYARRLSGRTDVRLVMTRHLVRSGKTSLPYRWIYRQLDCLVFVSELARSAFYSTHPPMPVDRTIIIHTGIELPVKIIPIGIRSRYGIGDTGVVAMYHGRLAYEKGVHTLIDAMTRLRDLPLWLVMVGAGDESLHRLAVDKQVDDRVIFAGFQHPVLPWVVEADFGVLPSMVREACPLAPQEYMSQGIPVVATDNGGQREYIADGINGLLVPHGAPERLAEAMRTLATDADFRRKLGCQAKIDFDCSLTYDHLYSAIRNLYQQLGL